MFTFSPVARVLATIPDPLQIVLVGGIIPEADVAGMYRLHDHFKTAATEIGRSVADLDVVRSQLEEAYSGIGGDEAGNWLSELGKSSAELQRMLVQTADDINDQALDIDVTQAVMTIFAAFAAWQIKLALAGALAGGPAVAALVSTAAQKTLLAMAQELMQRLLAGGAKAALRRAALVSMQTGGLLAGIDVAYKGQQFLQGHREVWDWSDIGSTAARNFTSGSVMGLAGAMGHEGGRVLLPRITGRTATSLFDKSMIGLTGGLTGALAGGLLTDVNSATLVNGGVMGLLGGAVWRRSLPGQVETVPQATHVTTESALGPLAPSATPPRGAIADANRMGAPDTVASPGSNAPSKDIDLETSMDRVDAPHALPASRRTTVPAVVSVDWLRSEPATTPLSERLGGDTVRVLDRYPGSSAKLRELDAALNPPWRGMDPAKIDATLPRALDDAMQTITREVPPEHFDAIVDALQLDPRARSEMLSALRAHADPGTTTPAFAPHWRNAEMPDTRVEYRLDLRTLMDLQAGNRDGLSAVTLLDQALHGTPESLPGRIAAHAEGELGRAVTDFARAIPPEHFATVVNSLGMRPTAQAPMLDSLHRVVDRPDSGQQAALRAAGDEVVRRVGADSPALRGVDVRSNSFREEAAVQLSRFGPHDPRLVYRPDHVELYRPGLPSLRGSLDGPLVEELAAANQNDTGASARIPGDPVVSHRLPTEDWGEFRVSVFESLRPGEGPVVAAILGTPEQLHARPPLVRLHSRCLYGDVMHSTKCDCLRQLHGAFDQMRDEGAGVVLYFDEGRYGNGHEGRGVGIYHKAEAYREEDRGLNTVEAFDRLQFPHDQRQYSHGAYVLRHLGLENVRLMTNNPRKIAALEEYGIALAERVPQKYFGDNRDDYLDVKRRFFDHMFDPNDFPS
ncbi:GTP cyclohydrolase II RibA [Nocardia sp. N2S4-5]|uniref:GTP cyclohydrolase II RibA n=1 Tax=Nocardia sp. N2S4-5 TaxID=3351565 RepID=UPI0037D8C8D9